MCCQGLTSIFTGLTVLAVLAGGAVMLHLLTKPKVSLLSLAPIQWSYIYEGGEKKVGTRITVEVKLLNSGSEHTNIDGAFKTSDGQIFHLSERLLLQGHGTVITTIISLDSPSIITHGTKLKGLLALEPWHNRRLFIGKKRISRQMEVIEGEYNKGKE